MNSRSIATMIAAGLVLSTLACGRQQQTARAPEAPAQSAPAPRVAAADETTQAVSPGISVSDEIAQACHLHFGNVERAPKFEFDRSELLASDRGVLDRVGECVTSGPLKGRRLQLIGRADPRGTEMYNEVLGARRAESVASYLAKVGVESSRIAQSSRGELDARGTDETTWALDRRVDVLVAD
jgi:peptidoglycan-associated lipoprotein